jgi:hypothetical protein
VKELTTKVTIFSAVVTCPSSKVDTHTMSKSLTVWLSIHTWRWSGWYFSYNRKCFVMSCAHYTLKNGFVTIISLWYDCSNIIFWCFKMWSYVPCQRWYPIYIYSSEDDNLIVIGTWVKVGLFFFNKYWKFSTINSQDPLKIVNFYVKNAYLTP